MLCTKPLGRTAAEAAEMLDLVRAAGVFHGYLENEVFSPEVMKTQEMVASGALGRVLTMRAREGHSGPHAAHFWDAETAGGGAFLDMGCHCIEAARYIIGKDAAVADVFAWGATLGHADKTTGEDNAIAILRFEDGRTATIEASWTAKGGIEVRNEIYCERGRIVHDLGSTPIRAFLQEPVGYLAEKTDADTGWVYPVADEPRVAGYDELFRHFVEAFATGDHPARDVRGRLRREHDHRCRLSIDAQRALGSGDRRARRERRSMTSTTASPRSSGWRLRASCSTGWPTRRPARSSRPASGRPTRSPRAGWSTRSGPATRGSRSRSCSRATARIPASTRWSSCR